MTDSGVHEWAKSGSLAVLVMLGCSIAQAAPTFYSTTDPDQWLVSAHVNQPDASSFSSPPQTTGFLTGETDFHTAVSITGRGDYIANNSAGTNGCSSPGCAFVQFVFRQRFDLTGFDPATVNLQFRWAADDIGNSTGAADRGRWQPQFKLNGGAFQDAGLIDYGYSNYITTLTSGFVSGINTIDFYVQGNSVTDGMALQTVAFTATPAVPEPQTVGLLLSGLLAVVGFARRRQR